MGGIARQPMSVRHSWSRACIAGRLAVVACAAAGAALPASAGHEVPYYPSFYPQEIRIEPLDPAAAAREFGNGSNPLHAYIGASPRFAGGPPPYLKAAESLMSFVTAHVNPRSPRLGTREARCAALTRAAAALAKNPDVVVHPYPVTPFHADYIGHGDRVPDGNRAVAGARAEGPALTYRPAHGIATVPHAQAHPAEWDIGFDEIPLTEVTRKAGTLATWPAPAMAKAGWFQAYHLLRPDAGEVNDRRRVDALYDRLARAEFRDVTERIALE